MVAITGVSATAAAGTVGASIAVRLTGVSAQVAISNAVMGSVFATAEVGNVGFQKGATIPLTGVQASAAAGSFDATLDTLNTITTREIGPSPKGAPLTNVEVDSNFLSLQNNKLNKVINLNRVLYSDNNGVLKELPIGPLDSILYSAGPTASPYWAPNPGDGAGIPIALSVEGVPQSTSISSLNFEGPGVVITETAPGQFTITIAGSGVAESESEYYPGYTFNYIDNDTFSIVGLDASALFAQGRRLVFKYSGLTIYGVISSSDYNITTAGDTTINMAMEEGNVLPSGISVEFGLTTSGVSWSPIANPPFTGESINDIISGKVGATNFIIAVADNGQLAYSINSGLTWTEVATGTTENIRTIAYDSSNQRFLAGGNAGVLLKSSTGSSWALDTTTVPALAGTTGTSDIWDMEYHAVDDRFLMSFNLVAGANAVTYVSADFGVTWPTSLGSAAGPYGKIAVTDAIIDDIFRTSGTVVSQNVSIIDSTPATFINAGYIISAVFMKPDATTPDIFIGGEGGQLAHYLNITIQSLDDTHPAFAINDIAYSSEHQRYVAVGDNATIYFLDEVDDTTDDAWTSVPNGFNPTADINAVHYDYISNLFYACNSAGQICRSSNGVN